MQTAVIQALVSLLIAGLVTYAMKFDPPAEVMTRFQQWLKENAKDRLMFVSDNNGFDWQFINWYFHHFLGKNPFGFSSMNLGSLYKGLVKETSQNFKHLRKTKHTHNPVDDAMGNAEALLHMALPRARALVARLEEEPHVNPNTGTTEFSLRDPDGYYVTISAFSAA